MSDLASLQVVLDDWQDWAKDVLRHKFNRSKLDYCFSTKNALALIGVRRSGKTYYSFDVAEKYFTNKKEKNNFLYMNFEDPYFTNFNSTEELDNLIQLYAERFLKEPELVILDEIQNIKAWEKWVRKQVEMSKFKIIVTGSSAKLLSKEISSSLTGRCIEKSIWTLSFTEYLNLQFQDKSKPNRNESLAYLKKYMLEGSFPELISISSEHSRTELLKQYLQDIIYRDIVNRYQLRSVHDLNLVLNYYLTKLSSTHSSYSIKKALGIHVDTATEYTQYLEDSFLIFTVERYHHNLKVQRRDPKKIYVIDNGLRNANSRSASDDLGKLFENLVYLELRRQNREIYYYKANQEVDFIITENYKPIMAIQACYGDLSDQSTQDREVSALQECLEELNLSEGFIISWDREETLKLDNHTIRIVPYYKWV